jgi:deoxyadenosine/deoxycytidine kinase
VFEEPFAAQYIPLSNFMEIVADNFRLLALLYSNASNSRTSKISIQVYFTFSHFSSLRFRLTIAYRPSLKFQ